MSYLANAGTLLLEVLFGILSAIVVLRVMLQLVRADFYNPISQFLYTATNPVLMPLRRVLPPIGRLDTAGSLLAWLLQILKVLLLSLLAGPVPGVLALLVLGLAELLGFVLTLYFWLILIRIVVSWLGGGYHPALPLLGQLTEPLLRPVRRRMPDLGGIDLSPMVVMLLLLLVRILVVAPITDLGILLARASW
jgi:YggT family protein